ncbi:hypothetical protein PV721_27485 [Streptomyces sp. MB09-01]|uniref:hypothetical protein n=1 Tax=Streptomyces sp. MB09-01 TaxID=3028666 RepID=UPI0029B40861|nr:hypothetical protein [Streptomyces sp. MB09-01]MDX3538026.1 hypothetical protein [Streptomyces sp. MB09-01]
MAGAGARAGTEARTTDRAKGEARDRARAGSGPAVRAGVLAAGLTAVVLAAGCSAPQATPDTRPRMKQVAAAWEGSAALTQWREGFHLLDRQEWKPPEGFHSEGDEEAYAAKSFVLRTELPATPPPATAIRWPDGNGNGNGNGNDGGATLTLPLQNAAQAYGELDRAPDGGPALAVTGVRFGEIAVRTSRGPARVPAWLFTVEGYETPLARLAVTPQELPKVPVEPLGTFDGGTAPLLVYMASPAATELTVQAGHGSCDGGVAVDVLEGADTVVLAGRIVADAEPGTSCDAAMRLEMVPVALARPLGARLVIDAATGAPLAEPLPQVAPATAAP